MKGKNTAFGPGTPAFLQIQKPASYLFCGSVDQNRYYVYIVMYSLNRYPKSIDEVHQIILALQQDEISTLILQKSSEIDLTTENGESCLILATKLQNTEAVEKLLQAGCDVHHSDNGGNTAMYYARRIKNYTIINLLEKYGASCANTLYDTIRNTSFDRRFEKRIQKNVYNLRRISTEFHAASHRRTGSFQDIIYDYQKRGLFSDEFNIIQVNILF